MKADGTLAGKSTRKTRTCPYLFTVYAQRSRHVELLLLDIQKLPINKGISLKHI